MNFPSDRPVHFVGIGGAGMSAIAKVLLERGWRISGTDLKPSRATAMLESLGATVHIGHSADVVSSDAIVVVSSAIPDTNPEVARARDLGLPIVARGQALAWLLSDYKAVVVAGTHGKTTTTSMIATILETDGLEPTYLVGGELNDAGTNARHGASEIAVAESDESDGSFLLLHPWIGVITNMEADHLDYWGSFEAIAGGFRDFISNVAPRGVVVAPAHDQGLMEMARASGRSVVSFDEGGDVEAIDLSPSESGTSFVLRSNGERASVSLAVPGRHNVANALAAAAAALAAGVDLETVAAGLGRYGGVKRRFQVRGQARGVTVIDDYAHHPSEVKAILATARSGPWERVVAVFQPHRYSRTSAFWRDFGGAFSEADHIVVTDVYGAGEQPVPGVTGKLVVDAIGEAMHGRPVAYMPHRTEVIDYLANSVRSGDAVLTLGAGDVTSLGEELLARLEPAS